MSHYFINDDSLSREQKRIDYTFNSVNFTFVTTAGVFSKDNVDYATNILLNAMPPFQRGGTLLDMGCGYGCIGIVLAKVYGLKLTQADINPRALELTRFNCDYNGVKSDVVLSDCFECIKDGFDTVVINPPVHAGKAVTYKMYEQAAEHLNSGGKLYVVTLKKHGAESTLVKLKEVFGEVDTIYKKKGFYVFECGN